MTFPYRGLAADHNHSESRPTTRSDSAALQADQSAPQRATSSTVKWIAYLLLVGVMLARLPQTQGMVEDGLPQEHVAELGRELAGVAVSLALMVGIVAFFIIMALYLSLATALERHVHPASYSIGGHYAFVRIGLFTTIVLCSILPIQVWALLAGELPNTPVRLAAVALICTAVLFAARRALIACGARRAVVVAATAITLGLLVSVF